MNESVSVRLMEAGTPETNEKEFPMFPPNSFGEMFVVSSDFARKLERERDEAQYKLEDARQSLEVALDDLSESKREIDEARYESDAQARLLGMSAEREASLRGKVFMLERELAKIKEAAKSVVEIWETPPWKIDATPSKAITQLRDAIGQED